MVTQTLEFSWFSLYCGYLVWAAWILSQQLWAVWVAMTFKLTDQCDAGLVMRKILFFMTEYTHHRCPTISLKLVAWQYQLMPPTITVLRGWFESKELKFNILRKKRLWWTWKSMFFQKKIVGFIFQNRISATFSVLWNTTISNEAANIDYPLQVYWSQCMLPIKDACVANNSKWIKTNKHITCPWI